MATATLVNHDKEIGRRIVAALTQASIPVTVSLWAFIPELEEWRFIVATPLVDSKGPLDAYNEVNRALDQGGVIDDISLTAIYLRSPNDRVLKALEKESRELPRESFRVVNAPIAGSFVEDAYVYRGFIHIVRDRDESGAECYLAFYAPRTFYAPRKGPRRGRGRLLKSIEDVRQFLQQEVHMEKTAVESKTRELQENGGVSIPDVRLDPRDLRRLKLG